MQRLVNVYHPERKNLLDNYENVNISDVDNIVNHSVDFIKFNDLELFEYQICKQIFSIILSKLRLGGSLVIGITDYKIISKLYADTVLSDDEFLYKINNVKSVWSKDLVLDTIKVSHKDIEINKIQNDNQNHIIYITLNRKSI